MTRQRSVGPFWSLRGVTLSVVLTLAGAARAEPAVAPDVAVRQLLQANPIVAPYNISTSLRNGQVVLSGAVGTKQIHDIAIRLAIATGYPIRDDLVIYTALAHRVAAAQAQAQLQAQAQAQAAAPGAGGVATAPSLGYGIGNLPYVYPPPLFGRIDDPFFGFEPPILSYPPWWPAVAQRGAATISAPAPALGNTTTADASQPVQVPLGPNPQDGVVEMTIDPRGCAVLRGTVPSLADRIAIGQKIAQTPGVTEVLNLLQVAVKPGANGETPPPPPKPGLAPEPAAPAAPAAAPPVVAPAPAGAAAPEGAPGAAQPAVVIDAGALNDRLSQAFLRRPALAGLPIRVTVRDGVATLSGKVPTVYEAMLAFRVVEQTPGIREVIDRLEFVVPDGERQNPLIKQGRPEDVEPYLLAQIRRNTGDLAHIDRLRVLGDTVELHGTLAHAADRPRLDAILRSIAVLRGFRVDAHLDAE
jgi:osmotically-inducible protein OsmY